MRTLFYTLVILICTNCKSGLVHGIVYDCRIFEGEFDAFDYIKGRSIDSSYAEFVANVDNGAFFVQSYLLSNFSRAILLRNGGNGGTIVDLETGKKAELSGTTMSHCNSILASMENGSFRQVCSDGPSEGSISVLLVKIQGKIQLKYEAGQHDYSHLNENERVKIKNALALITLMIDNTTE